MMTCPRCGHEQTGQTDCQSCGVIFTRFEAPRPLRARPRPTPRGRTGSWIAPALVVGILLLLGPILYRTAKERVASPGSSAIADADLRSIGEPPDAGRLDDAPATITPIELEPTATDTGSARPAPATADTVSTHSSSAENVTPENVSPSDVRDLERRVAADATNIRQRLALAAAQTALAEQYLRQRQPELALTNLRRALTHDPTNSRIQLLLVAALSQAGRTSDARAALAQVNTEGRQQAIYHVLSADILYAEEELSKALAALLEAQRIAPGEEIAERIARVRKELSAGTDHNVDSRHFRAVFTGRANAVVGREVLRALESSYPTIERELPIDTLSVTAVLYSDEDYRRIMGAPDWAAASFDGKIRVPIAGLSQIDARMRQTLEHELAHAFIYERGGNAVPRWLHEGLAQRFSGRRLRDFGLDEGDRKEIAHGPTEGNPSLFYARSLWIVDFFYERYGRAKMLALLDEMKNGSSFDDALRKVTRVTWRTFESEFTKWTNE